VIFQSLNFAVYYIQWGQAWLLKGNKAGLPHNCCGSCRPEPTGSQNSEHTAMTIYAYLIRPGAGFRIQRLHRKILYNMPRGKKKIVVITSSHLEGSYSSPDSKIGIQLRALSIWKLINGILESGEPILSHWRIPIGCCYRWLLLSADQQHWNPARSNINQKEILFY
jgi:hypothetical protein